MVTRAGETSKGVMLTDYANPPYFSFWETSLTHLDESTLFTAPALQRVILWIWAEYRAGGEGALLAALSAQ